MAIDLKGIHNIIFDMGGVILDLDFDSSIRAFYTIGLKEDMMDGKLAYFDPIFYKLQTGTATPEEFRAKIRELIPNPGATDQQVDNAWCAMLAGIPASRIEKIQGLREKYKIYLFSNTNKIHIDHLESGFFAQNGFTFASVFDGVAYSHEIFDAKPTVSSFKKVIRLFGVDPRETLFVDDIEENTQSAETAGLKTLWLKHGMDIRDIF